MHDRAKAGLIVLKWYYNRDNNELAELPILHQDAARRMFFQKVRMPRAIQIPHPA
jgi:hypothetical protein